MSNEEIVMQALTKAGKALKPGELVDICGLSRPEVDKAIKQLKKQEKITSPKVCFWEPSK